MDDLILEYAFQTDEEILQGASTITCDEGRSDEQILLELNKRCGAFENARKCRVSTMQGICMRSLK